MRRQERMMAEESMVWQVVEEARWMVLSLVEAANPYAVPVLFVTGEGCLYVHGAREGRKAALLSRGVACCCVFVAEAEVRPAPEGAPCCAFSLRYRSAVATGRAEAVDDADEAARIAGLFCGRYGAGDRSLGDAAVDATMFWRIAVDSLVGKKANC